jgi:hypothetical protein
MQYKAQILTLEKPLHGRLLKSLVLYGFANRAVISPPRHTSAEIAKRVSRSSRIRERIVAVLSVPSRTFNGLGVVWVLLYDLWL